MSKAIGYVRVSTERQADHGVSLDAQRERIATYCAAQGIELVGIESDEGISGKTLDRPGIKRALARLRAGEADTLVVTKLDRLSRSVRDILALVDEVFAERRGAKRGAPLYLRSVDAMLDTASPQGRMMLSLMALFAQWEREQIAERTRSALAYLKSQGVRLGQLPYGLARAEPDAGQKRLAIVAAPAEAAAAAAAVELRRSGASLRKTAVALERAGLAPRRASGWSPSSVVALLASRRRQAALPRVPLPGGELVVDVLLVEHADSANSERRRRDTIRRKMNAKAATAAALVKRWGEVSPGAGVPELPVTVEIELTQGPRGRRWDGDNAVARAKGIRDTVAGWLGVDDAEGAGVDAWDVRVAHRRGTPAATIRIKARDRA